MFSVFLASAALVSGVCDDSKLSRSDVEKQLVSDVLPSLEKREQAEKSLKAGSGKRCREVLSDYLDSLKQHKERTEFVPVRSALLNLAANGGVAGALEIVEREVSAGHGEDLLDALERASAARYRAALRVWLRNAAKQVVTQNEQDGAKARVVSPLFLERFLRALAAAKEKPSEADYSDLNSIFAGTPAGHRDVFLPLYGNALREGVYGWIISFRKEPLSTQFRLFPIFEAVGGPEVVKELMWLSQNHPDQRIRALAERSLNKILQSSQRK